MGERKMFVMETTNHYVVQNENHVLLERIAIALENIAGLLKKKEEDRWVWMTDRDTEEKFPDPEKYDWVLVKIRMLEDDLKTPYGEVISLPRIAEYRNGNWHNLETYEKYGTETLPFEVVAWRPLPDDEPCVKLLDYRENEIHKVCVNKKAVNTVYGKL